MPMVYAYLYLRENGTPYYAGKGTGRRAFRGGRFKNDIFPPADKTRIVILLRASAEDALETEKELIRNWGRKDLGTGCLLNRTAGGDNPPSHKGEKRPWVLERNQKGPTSETCRKMSIAAKHKPPVSLETRAKLSAASIKAGCVPPWTKKRREISKCQR